MEGRGAEGFWGDHVVFSCQGGRGGPQSSLRKYKGGTGKNCQFTANQLPR